MSTNDKHRTRLETLKYSLLEDLKRGAEGAGIVELEQNKVGRLSRMDAMQQQEMHKASQLLIKSRLVQIDRALTEVDSGDYGYCDLCGEEIPEQRLAIKPESLRCVSCQEKSEI